MRGGGTLVPCTLLPVYASVPCPSFIPWLSAVTSQEGGRNLRLLKPIGERQRDRSRPSGQWGGATRGTLLSWQKRETLITSEKK